MDDDGSVMAIMSISISSIFFICLVGVILFLVLHKNDDGSNILSSLLNTPGKYTDGTSIPIDRSALQEGSVWKVKHVSNQGNLSVEGNAFKFRLRKGISGGKSGASFAANPHGKLPVDACTISYRLFIPDDFPLDAKGGKLPGLCIGRSFQDCATGGEYSTVEGSIRPMFRENKVILYVYPPGNNSDDAFKIQGKDYKSQAKQTKSGHQLWHTKSSDLTLRRGWNDIRIEARLNSIDKQDGYLSIGVNGSSNSVSDAVLRTQSSVKISSVKMVVFFGGSGKEWEVNKDTHVLIKDCYIDV